MKSLKLLLSALTLCFFASHLQAQLHVESSGEVGIGLTNPSAKLDVTSTSTRALEVRQNYTGASTKYGIYNYLNGSGTGVKYGLYNRTAGGGSGTAQERGLYNYHTTYATTTVYGQYTRLHSYGGNATRFGLYNYLTCGSGDGTGSRYALYSRVQTTCDGGAAYAGYFVGNVYISGTLTQPSDESKKRNVETMSGGLDLLNRLRPTTYNYIEDPDMNLPEGKQFGFIAQELEQVFPELVKEIETHTAPTEVGEDGEMSDPEVTGTIKSVNYVALIPVLVQAIQEQQAEIEALKAELARK